jgi:hypothetical protein
MGTFPALSDDAVQQWAVEEALMERLEHEERRQEEQAIVAQRVADAERRVAKAVGMRMQ